MKRRMNAELLNTNRREDLSFFVDYYTTKRDNAKVLDICKWDYNPAKPWAILGNGGVALMLLTTEDYSQVMDICKEKHITIVVNY